MPSPQQLTDAQRRAQAALAAELVLRLRPLWRILDPLNVAGTVASWLEAALPVLSAFRSRSSQLSANYLVNLRSLEVGPSNFVPTLAGDLDRTRAVTSLVVTGPRRVQATAKRLDAMPTLNDAAKASRLQAAVDEAFATSTAAAQRHVVNGGRETAVFTTEHDPKALGWLRVSDGDPCSFCAMLISRGPVYKGESFSRSDPRFLGPGEFKAHDFDGCTLKPVYSHDDPAIDASERWSDLWLSATRGKSGKDAQAAFRAAFSAR